MIEALRSRPGLPCVSARPLPYDHAVRVLTPVRVAPPAPLADGETGLAHTVGADGVIGVLATSEPEPARGFAPGPHGGSTPYYRPPRSCPAMFYTYRAGAWERLELECLPVSYPMVALLPDGEAVVACPRLPWADGEREPRNAHVFGPDGALRRGFALGDAIETLVVDDAGTIWTAHGEEAWQDSGGLVRRDARGVLLWDSGIASQDDALNCNRGVAWAYRGPSLVRIQDGATAEYDSPVDRVRALAFDGDRMLLVGRGDRMAWCRVDGGGRVRRLDDAEIAGPFDDPQVLGCHGPYLYLHDLGDGYHRVAV